MRRIDPPSFCAWDATKLAASKFAGRALERKVCAAECDFTLAYAAFDEASRDKNWYQLSSCRYGNGDQVILGGITKDEFRSLYSDGLVNGVRMARNIYDKIKLSAEGRCPYCGGIGDVDPLDHYVPKARYPQYAVFPGNLIPCCDKCNKLSGSSKLESYSEQTLNPYFDDDKFFRDPWISVRFFDDDLFNFLYFFDPPAEWPAVDKERAKSHFDKFQLAKRYAANASSEIGYLATDFPFYMKKGGDMVSVGQYLLSRANASSYIINGWQRPLYRALSQCDWYLRRFA